MQNFQLPEEEEIKRWVRESVREELKEIMLNIKDISGSKEEPLVTRKEIGQYLRISLVTLSSWKKRGLPCHQKRGRVLFLKSEVLDWLKSANNDSI
jgi:hypothetical protein